MHYFWVIAGTQTVLVAVLCQCNFFHHRPNPSRKKLLRVALGRGAISFPLFYLRHGFLEGLSEKG